MFPCNSSKSFKPLQWRKMYCASNMCRIPLQGHGGGGIIEDNSQEACSNQETQYSKTDSNRSGTQLREVSCGLWHLQWTLVPRARRRHVALIREYIPTRKAGNGSPYPTPSANNPETVISASQPDGLQRKQMSVLIVTSKICEDSAWYFLTSQEPD